MHCWRLLCVLLALVAVGESSQVPQSKPSLTCTTSTNQRGRCIPINQCKVITNLPSSSYGEWNRRPNRLQHSVCGWKVCCPEKQPNFVSSQASRPVNHRRPGSGQHMRQVDQVLPEPKNAAFLAEDLCGTTAAGNRVLGGENVSLGEFPWMALLQYERVRRNDNAPRSLSYRCGGALISKRYVLTAAHCVHPGSISGYKLVGVRLGEHNKEVGTEDQDCEADVCSEPVVDLTVEQAIYHPEFDSSDINYNNDIALIRLPRDVTFTRYIRPICLPHQANLRTKDFSGQRLPVSGWGRTEDALGQVIFASSNVLKKASLPVMNSARCTQVWAPDQIVKADMQICAGGTKGIDVCKGDSGGPLMSAEKVARDRTVRYHVIGVVSYGERCKLTVEGKAQKPGVFTRVSFFVDWILDQLKP